MDNETRTVFTRKLTDTLADFNRLMHEPETEIELFELAISLHDQLSPDTKIRPELFDIHIVALDDALSFMHKKNPYDATTSLLRTAMTFAVTRFQYEYPDNSYFNDVVRSLNSELDKQNPDESHIKNDVDHLERLVCANTLLRPAANEENVAALANLAHRLEQSPSEELQTYGSHIWDCRLELLTGKLHSSPKGILLTIPVTIGTWDPTNSVEMDLAELLTAVDSSDS